MLCERCHKNPVTVHLQQNINGVKQELHLCQECASQAEMPISFELFFQGFLDTFFSADQMNKTETGGVKPKPAACPHCGLSYGEFKSSGRLGCSYCYSTFRSEMSSLLKSIQGSSQHQGKFPKKAGADMLAKRHLEELRLRLGKAIENEEYEDAARIRDEIRQLQSAGGAAE